MKIKSFLVSISIFLFAIMVSPKLFAQCQAGFTFTVNNATVSFTDASTNYTNPVYSWDFGDSQHDYIANPSHPYNAAGTYTVCLTVLDSVTLSCQNTFCLPVTVSVGCNNLSASATTVNATDCLNCDGTAAGSVTGGTSPYSYLWSNSSTATSQTNMCPGDYVLTVTDAIGCISNTNAHVGCPDTCHAAFNSSVSGNTIFVTNTSNDTAVNVQFQWWYGDASSSNLTSPGSHTYATSGTYTVTLVMVDNLNACTDTTSAAVVVGGPSSCASSFNMLEDSFNLSLWYLYPTATGQAPFTYLWDFGDTTTSTLASPTHVYNYACHHVVCMTITDANLCSSVFCDSSLTHRIASSTYIQTLVVINPLANVTEQNELSGSIFPNPVSDQLKISFNKNTSGTIRVCDMTGKLIVEQKFSGNELQMDSHLWSEGIYTISFQNGTESWNKKVVIVR